MKIVALDAKTHREKAQLRSIVDASVKAGRVLVYMGAGVSTSAGIPVGSATAFQLPRELHIDLCRTFARPKGSSPLASKKSLRPTHGTPRMGRQPRCAYLRN